MTPCRVKRSTLGRSAPCARREGPRSGLRTVQHRLLHACCVRGDDPSNGFVNLGTGICSSRPRGWSLEQLLAKKSRGVLRAPAGMAPASSTPAWSWVAIPRARGDGPLETNSDLTADSCSPRLQGWSLHLPVHDSPARLLPVPAGMVPWRPWWAAWRRSAPCTRGDGPPLRGAVRPVPSLLRPRPRGWFRFVLRAASCRALF